MYRSIILALVATFSIFALVGCDGVTEPSDYTEYENEYNAINAPENLTATTVEGARLTVKAVSLAWVNRSGVAKYVIIVRKDVATNQETVLDTIAYTKFGESQGYTDNLTGCSSSQAKYLAKFAASLTKQSQWSESNVVTLK